MGRLLFFLPIVLLWGGGQAAYTTFTNMKPTKLTVSEFIESRPNKKWLELTDGQQLVYDAAWFSFLGKGAPSEVFLPVVPRNETNNTDEIHVLLATSNPAILETIEALRSKEDSADALLFSAENHDKLIIDEVAKGVVRYGLDLDDREKRELTELYPNIVEDFIIIDDGKSPEWYFIFFLPLGLFLAWFMWWPSKDDETADAAPPPLPGNAGPPPLTPTQR